MRRRLLFATNEEQFVDLGLPSGALWARGNLCKDSSGNYYIGEETDWGTYVSWGNIDGHNEGESYGFGNTTTYNGSSGNSLKADITSFDAAHDIALARLGSPCHLPTKEQTQELYDNTDTEWVTDYNGSGVKGRKFMKKTDHSVFIFLPASGYRSNTLNSRGTNGYYWTSSLYPSSTYYACRLAINSSNVVPQDIIKRSFGMTVRPVSEPGKGYIIDQTDATSSNPIIKDNGASMTLSADEDMIAWINANTKIIAAELNLRNGKLICKETLRTDKTKYKDGTSITMSSVDLFVKLPEFWWSCTQISTNVFGVLFSKTEVSGWNHWEGNTFIGCYEAYKDGNYIYSRSDVTPTGNVSQDDFKTYARNRGTGYTLISYEAHCIMGLLGYGWIGKTDVKSVCGKGSTDCPVTTGVLNNRGMKDTSRYAVGATNFWGIENWWNDFNEFIDNIKTAGSYNVAVLNRSGSTVRSISTGLTSSTSTTDSPCIGRMKLGQYGDLVPIETHSNASANNGYYARGYVHSSSNIIALRSGAQTSGNLSYLWFGSNSSSAFATYGSRLQYKGTYTLDGVQGGD